MRLDRKKLFIFCTGILLIVLAIVILGKRKDRANQNDTSDRTLSLNFKLNNEMSDFPGIEKMDARVQKYMSYWHLNGTQLAVIRNDSLVFCKGYGICDSCPTPENPDSTLAMGPGNIMRVASVSKLITAVGIMKLQEEGRLRLDDQVFGPEGILCDSTYAIPEKSLKDYTKITVEHLLRHQAGFRRDPVFSALDVTKQLGLENPPTLGDYCGLVLNRKLRFAPGKSNSYSNFGYMLLTEIIESVSGEEYEEYIRKHVLEPCGCYDMHIANNYYEEKYPNESRYFVHEGDGKVVQEYNGSGRMVERCYGGNDINLLKGAGAWVCSAAELALLVASIDGKPGMEDILLPESVEEMLWCRRKEDYAIGWNETNPRKGWIRTGTLAGTNAVIKYFPDGECWIFLSNTSTWKGPNHFRYTSQLFDKLRRDYSGKIPSRNLFEI